MNENLKRPKSVWNTETPGTWIFDPGEEGYGGSYYEPPSPGYPPTIYAAPPEGFDYDPDEETHQVKIAEINPEPGLLALDYTPEHPYDDGFIGWGDYRYNGKLMAAAPEMWKLLQEMATATQTPGGVAAMCASIHIVDFVKAMKEKLEQR